MTNLVLDRGLLLLGLIVLLLRRHDGGFLFLILSIDKTRSDKDR